MAGDERYLPARSGPVRKVRPRHRRLATQPGRAVHAVRHRPVFFMFTPISVNYPMRTSMLLLFVVVMIVDPVVLGRLVSRRVRERYPDSADGGFKLGWYSFQPRITDCAKCVHRVRR